MNERRVGERAPLLIALVPFVLLAALHFPLPPLLASGDYAHYLLHAQAMLQGRAYVDTGYLYTTLNPWVGPRAYPPGVALTLLPILATVGPSLAAMKLVAVLSAVLFLLAAGRYFAAAADHWAAAAVVLLLGIALESAYATNVLMSDLGFCAFVWGALGAADAKGAWSSRRIAVVTLLGVGAIMYRVPGIALVPAMVLYTAVHVREHRLRPLVPAVAWSLVAAAQFALLPLVGAVVRGVPVRPVGLLNRVTGAVLGYRSAIAGSHLYPFGANTPNDAYHLVSLALMGLGLLAWLVRGGWRTFAAAFGACYFGMLLVVPVADGRYLWPLYPLLAFGFVRGLELVVGWLRPQLSPRRVAIAAFAGASLVATAATVRAAAAPRPDTLPDRPDVQELFARVAALDAGARIAFVNPRVLTWHTGVPAMPTFAASPDSAMAELDRQRITHLVVGDLGTAPVHAKSMEALVDTYPERFRPVFRNASFTVYRLCGCRSPASDRAGRCGC